MLCIWNIIALIGLFVVYADDQLFVPKRYVVHLTTSTWAQSLATCTDSGGSLATIYDFSTMPDIQIGQEYLLNENIFWIGLHRKNANHSYEWQNGDNITWYNWKPGMVEDIAKLCVASSSDMPYSWIIMDCEERLPFICQYNEGECQFVEFVNMSIASHNYMYLYEKSEDECKNVCIIQLGTRCRSFDFYPADGRCEFNSGDRWTLAKYYRVKEGWVYFHWTCNIGEVVNASISPSPTLGCLETSNIFVTHNIYSSHVITLTKEVPVSRDVPVTRDVILTSTFIDRTTITLTETSTHVIVASPTFVIPSASEDPIEELKEIGEVAVERRKTLKKISVIDKRPSAKYVGYVAIIFMSVVFGAIVLFDLLTLCRYLNCFGDKEQDEKSKPKADKGIFKKVFGWSKIKHRKQCNIEEEEIKNNLRQRCVNHTNNSSLTTRLDEDPTTSYDADLDKKTGRRSNMIWRPFILNMGDSGIEGSDMSSSPDPSDTCSDIFHFQYFPNEFDNIRSEKLSPNNKENTNMTTNF
ncbi:uncharacterized protein LOC132720554 [Ruditapes philippinarum]|uniref:uncharacterized protein LOC132720554 n=1 Tax=Ruditapes philippinarum TaxID=129788 RepID=UPI00295C205C|nr:uncharacterized protein LOC132720554 [Ruditapes philippinarum]